MGHVDTEDRTELTLLRNEVKQDIQLAVANFKVWLLVTVLSNVIMIGIPALYVFFNTTNTTQAALAMAQDNTKRLNDRTQFMTSTDARLSSIERHLQTKDQFVPAAPVAIPN